MSNSRPVATKSASRGPVRVPSRGDASAARALVRSDTWNGLHAGDPVVVAGLRIRGADWEFRAHVLNPRNGTESIEVVGGRAGDRRVRSFEPQRIFAVTGSRAAHGHSEGSLSGRLSLADAPQLPLE